MAGREDEEEINNLSTTHRHCEQHAAGLQNEILGKAPKTFPSLAQLQLQVTSSELEDRYA